MQNPQNAWLSLWKSSLDEFKKKYYRLSIVEPIFGKGINSFFSFLLLWSNDEINFTSKSTEKLLGWGYIFVFVYTLKFNIASIKQRFGRFCSAIYYVILQNSRKLRNKFIFLPKIGSKADTLYNIFFLKLI